MSYMSHVIGKQNQSAGRHRVKGGLEHSLNQMGSQDFLADGLLGQRQPELTGLQGHILVMVLGPLQHVLGQWKEAETQLN